MRIQALKERRTPRLERKDVDIGRRAAIVYLYQGGLTQDEIAEIVGLSQRRVQQILASSTQTVESKPWRTWRRY